MEKYAVALNQQGRFAPTRVGEFKHDPKNDRHIWQGKTASSMAELAEQTNAALKSLIDFRDPFLGIEIVMIEAVENEERQSQTAATGGVGQTRKLNAVGQAGCQTHQEVTV